jgi:hypothetical protein
VSYHGDIRLGDTIDLKFTTVDDTGLPTTLAGTPVVSAYPGNSTTQLTAGITLSVDFDSVTGLHSVRVVASGGNGYATATNYELVITTGTVDGVSVVGYVIGSFSIEARSALMPSTAGRTLGVESDGDLTKVNTLDGHTAQTGDAFARLGAPAGASVSADVAAVKSDTAEIGTAGAGLTNINLPNQTMDITGNITGNLSGSVGSVTGNVGGNVTGSVGSLAAQAKADVNAEVDGAIETYHLDHLLATAYDPASKPGAADALLNELVEDDGGVSRFTANALEESPTGGSAPTVGEIADAVWDEAQADHVGAGSFGVVASEIADILEDTGTTLQAELDGIQADTEDIQTRLPAALVNGRMDASVDGTGLEAAALAAINAEVDTALADYDGPTRAEATADKDEILTDVGTVDTVVDAIKAKTDSLTFTEAGQVDANVQMVNDVPLTGDGNATPWGPA